VFAILHNKPPSDVVQKHIQQNLGKKNERPKALKRIINAKNVSMLRAAFKRIITDENN